MPVDRPGDYVGNHGGAYRDIDGMSKQFTYIDHDKKTTILMPTSEKSGFDHKEYRSELIKRISDISASLCPAIFQDFTIRGEGKTKVEWNMDMLVDNGILIDRLRDLCVLTENSLELLKGKITP